MKKIILKNSKPTQKELDDLCREVVFLRDKATCQRCGRTKSGGWQLHWAHFYSRSIKAVRNDLDDSCVLCAGCHFWAHKNPAEFVDFWKERLGNENFHCLQLRRNCVKVDRWAVKLYLEAEKRKYA
jgi:5-methylcytosine-specific restriction endonuclease McrA